MEGPDGGLKAVDGILGKVVYVAAANNDLRM